MATNSKTVLVASKDLTIDGKPIKAGSTLATIEQGVPAERVLAGLGNGAVIEKEEFDRRDREKTDAARKIKEADATRPPPVVAPTVL